MDKENHSSKGDIIDLPIAAGTQHPSGLQSYQNQPMVSEERKTEKLKLEEREDPPLT